MDINSVNGYTLKNLGKINILLGKNGSGKSTLLRQVESGLPNDSDVYGKTRYITPERGGTLVQDAGITYSVGNDPNYAKGTRLVNQLPNFRQQSAAQYSRLENLVLREIEKDRCLPSFDEYIQRINALLDNVAIERTPGSGFRIFKKDNQEETREPSSLSSGESELISQTIETLIFEKENQEGKENIIFFDEPDVHLHPDLQVRFCHFLKESVERAGYRVVIATHSTAILGALENYKDTNICFMKSGEHELQFVPITDVYRRILPVFGAHPLSNLFNEAPILLVEGEDDERIWQQSVRSSEIQLKIYPCACGSVNEMNDYEQEVRKIITTVYDNAQAFSLRDRDDTPEEIDDLTPVVRFRLSCRNAENLLLTNEVLSSLLTNWIKVKADIDAWLEKNTTHTKYSYLKDFRDNGYDRKGANLKEIRMLLIGAIIGSNKPWEVAVGQVIGGLRKSSSIDYSEDGSIFSFLGKKLVENIIPPSN